MTSLFNTLLSELKEVNYDSLIDQETLLMKGWNVYYTIDADLLGNYCFPYGFNPSEERRRDRNITPAYIADEQVVLHTFFYLSEDNCQNILFNTYFQELKDMLRTASRFSSLHSSNSHSAEPYFTGFLSKVKQTTDDSGRGEILLDYFSNLIATILIRMEGVKKLQNLISTSALIYHSEKLNNPLIEYACELEQGEADSNRLIMGIYTDELKGKDPGESRKRDANVIDRTIRINNFIQDWGRGAEKKNIVLFAFDAPLSLRVMNNIQEKKLLKYPAIDGSRISFHRTTQEQFAYLICREYNDDGSIDRQKTIEKIKLLKEKSKVVYEEFVQTAKLLTEGKQKEAVAAGINDDFKALLDNYELLRNQFENAGLLKSFSGIYESVKHDLNGKNLEEIKSFLTDVKAKENELISELVGNQAKLLETLIWEANFNGSFIRGLKLIQMSELSLDGSKGADVVEGSYQHLPLYFRFSTIPSAKAYHVPIFSITRLILERQLSESAKVIDEIQHLIQRLYVTKSKKTSPLIDKLVKVFIYLLLPSSSSPSDKNKKENDVKAARWLTEIEKEGLGDAELRSEFLYIKCWVWRRIGDYVTAGNIAMESMKEFTTDPRFPHGKFLADYCLYMDKPEEYRNVHQIDKIIQNTDVTVNLYEKFIMENYAANEQKVIKSKLIDTFANNYAYFLSEKSLLMYEKHQPAEALETIVKARKYMKILLQYDGEMKEPLAEYYDTLSNLEYVESFFARNYNPEEKLNNAIAAINQAVQLSSNTDIKKIYEKERIKFRNRLSSIRQR